ncbi:MAG: single-stranded-DNA-specific exonuclease RecJ [Candidatus Beckwithbacteria bacterium]|nr:single-stranded-DNA-specific exonuclease RecJ [Candidatus Beckwithbacteria bacterium]
MNKNWKIILSLLKKRGLITKKDQVEFLNPTNPEKIKLKDLKISKIQVAKAISRIKQAIKNQELIYIYGDYDTDGVSATAILWEALNFLGAKVLPYIPVRNDPVRGLSPTGIGSLKDHPSLIITVDNGISAFKGCEFAKKLGIDVIITDHHLPQHRQGKVHLPPALTIIHTTELAGAGVAWFFSREILKSLNTKSYMLNTILDLAALGTIADMVPLIGPNRSLVKFGLQQLRQTQRFGLKALAKVAGLDLTNISEHQVSFIFAPRLNAMGRMEHALNSLRLVCTKDKERGEKLAKHLGEINQLRQDKTLTMFLDAKKKWLTTNQKKALIFVADKSYHEGVVGLVAGRLAEEFHHPSVVIALGKNYSKASIRSIKGFNAIKNIRSLERYLLEHGGHELAAGFTIDNKNIKLVQKKLENLAQTQLSGNQLQPVIEIDCEIKLSDITWDLMADLEKLRPFGFGNSEPVFCTSQVKLINFRPVGQDNKHLKLRLEKFSGIAFNQGYLADKLTPGQLVNIAYTLEKNEWHNKKELQLKIKEIITT